MSTPPVANIHDADSDTHGLPELRLRPREEKRLAAGHLWIFSNEVDTAATPLTAFEPGAAVQVHSDRDQFLGFAYVNPRTLIAARIVTRDAAYPLDGSLLVHRLRVALALREKLYREPYYRLAFGESDGLPGLVLDRYGDVLVAQSGTAGIDRLRAEIEAAVAKVVGTKTLVWKNDSGARDLEGLALDVSAAHAAPIPEEITVREQGVEFVAPLAQGQKTGWFYDQAANRERLRRYLPAGARARSIPRSTDTTRRGFRRAGASTGSFRGPVRCGGRRWMGRAWVRVSGSARMRWNYNGRLPHAGGIDHVHAARGEHPGR